MMQEVVILSGKGGTGKTTIVGALAALWQNVILVDCDVDAANLHLITRPVIRDRHIFRASRRAVINAEDCTACGLCLDYCRFEAIKTNGDWPLSPSGFRIDPLGCEGCGLCARICPDQAIEMQMFDTGEWYLSETPFGPLVHGRLAPAQGNSGMLVTLLRNQAAEIATGGEFSLTLVDGPPGISCPTIASLTGSSYALLVTEPSLSAFHDLRRLIELITHFRVPAGVLINKYDINEQITTEIEDYARSHGLAVLGRLAYDRDVSRAQLQKRTIYEFARQLFGAQLQELRRKLTLELKRIEDKRKKETA